jgi:hypothetical protein
VLDADATTSRTLSGRIVGFYRPTGPNSWDDYELVDADGGPIEVYPETPIQIEKQGAAFRMRRQGQVIVVAWAPEPGEIQPGGEIREQFLRSCVRDEDPTPEGNLGVWLHGELSKKREPSD